MLRLMFGLVLAVPVFSCGRLAQLDEDCGGYTFPVDSCVSGLVCCSVEPTGDVPGICRSSRAECPTFGVADGGTDGGMDGG